MGDHGSKQSNAFDSADMGYLLGCLQATGWCDVTLLQYWTFIKVPLELKFHSTSTAIDVVNFESGSAVIRLLLTCLIVPSPR